MNTLKKLAMVALISAVMPIRAMVKDTYADAIDAGDVDRVYALLIAEEPVSQELIMCVVQAEDRIERAIRDTKGHYRVDRLKAEQIEMCGVANVFRVFIKRGNLQKPNSFSQNEWTVIKKKLGVFEFTNDEGKITAPTFAAFKEEEQAGLDDLIKRASNYSAPSNKSRDERLDALIDNSAKILEELSLSKRAVSHSAQNQAANTSAPNNQPWSPKIEDVD